MPTPRAGPTRSWAMRPTRPSSKSRSSAACCAPRSTSMSPSPARDSTSRSTAAAASLDTALSLAPGDELTLGTRRGGARAYVAVRGGLDVPLLLGSRSAWPLLPRRGALEDGVRLAVGTRVVAPVRMGTWPTPAPVDLLRVVPGPEVQDAPEALSALCAGTYRVTSGGEPHGLSARGASRPAGRPHASVEWHRDRGAADPAVRPARCC